MSEEEDAAETNPIMSNVIFIILNLLFFMAMFLFVSRTVGGDSVYEQTYAKQIALIVGDLRPESTISLDITELYLRADKNKFNLDIKLEDNLVTVKVKNGKGYSFPYFTENNLKDSLNPQTRDLVLIVT